MFPWFIWIMGVSLAISSPAVGQGQRAVKSPETHMVESKFHFTDLLLYLQLPGHSSQNSPFALLHEVIRKVQNNWTSFIEDLPVLSIPNELKDVNSIHPITLTSLSLTTFRAIPEAIRKVQNNLTLFKICYIYPHPFWKIFDFSGRVNHRRPKEYTSLV